MSALVCAMLMPHAPILIPAISGERGRGAEASVRALREAAKTIVRHAPETIVLISPHAPRRSGAFGLWTDESVAGTFEPFGFPRVGVKLPGDRRLTNAIVTECHARNVATWNLRHTPLDHGALVPLWFLVEAGWAGPVVVASLNYPDEGGLTSFGEAIAAAASAVGRRIAVIASGDMSHCLTEYAPCGFNPRAHLFDEEFIRLLRAGNYRKLPDMNAGLRENAAEDAVDSTIVAVAAAGWNNSGHAVLNYEGPFGVGYGVAILHVASAPAEIQKPVLTAGECLPGVARHSVEAALHHQSGPPPPAKSAYLNRAAAVFVTIRHRGGKLRGCIGTIQPATANVVTETWRNARLAALQDSRFEPVTLNELPQLRFEVSVLHPPEEIGSEAELDPKRYGVIVSTEDGRRGLLLPAIEGISTVPEQVLFARRKGRIDPEEPVRLERFEVERFSED